MRYLAIDLGEKRTGLAVGDDQSGIASPAGTLKRPPGPELVAAILKAIEVHEPDAIVLGLPLNMDGTEGTQARRVREFGRDLAQRIDRPLHYQDERLTSYAADQRLAGSGRTHKEKKELRDALEAAEILRDFLEAGSGGSTPGA